MYHGTAAVKQRNATGRWRNDLFHVLPGKTPYFFQSQTGLNLIDGHPAFVFRRVQAIARQVHVADFLFRPMHSSGREFIAQFDSLNPRRATRNPRNVALQGDGVDSSVGTINEELLRCIFCRRWQHGRFALFRNHRLRQPRCRNHIQPRVNADCIDDAIAKCHASHRIEHLPLRNERMLRVRHHDRLGDLADVYQKRPVVGVRHHAMRAGHARVRGARLEETV